MLCVCAATTTMRACVLAFAIVREGNPSLKKSSKKICPGSTYTHISTHLYTSPLTCARGFVIDLVTLLQLLELIPRPLSSSYSREHRARERSYSHLVTKHKVCAGCACVRECSRVRACQRLRLLVDKGLINALAQGRAWSAPAAA